MTKSLYLIDGHAQIHRAFHALGGLSARDGRPSGAIFGFTRTLQDIIRQQHPDYLIVVFDAPGKTFRHEQFPDYKATRKPTDPDLLSQITPIQEIVKAFSIPVYSEPGFEADDVLGTLAILGAKANLDVVLVTSDKDCQQLLQDSVRMYDPRKDKFITAESFTEEKGIRPDQLVDLMGLWGDTADNIPGVPGIGEKIGIELIAKYGSLEKLLHHGAEIKGKRGEKIRECADLARLSKDLATIRTDVAVTLDLDNAKLSAPDADELRRLYEDWDLHQFLHELDEESTAESEAEGRAYELVNTGATFAAFLKALRHEEVFALDTETTSEDPLRADLVGISVSWSARGGYYLPFRAPEGTPVLGETELNQLARILEDDSIHKVGQNLKYDALVLRRAGVHLRGVGFDTLLASHILAGHLRGHGLDELALRHYGIKKIPTKELLGTGKKQITMDHVPIGLICEYACEDADITWRLYRDLATELEKRGETHILQEIELPLAEVLTDMQEIGIRVDADLLATQSKELGTLLDALTAEIHTLAGHDFNIASPKQLAAVLFEEIGCPVIRKTKTGASTDEATLHELKRQGFEIAERLLDYRLYSKLKSTYLDALPAMIHPDTGRIHTTLSQTGTATGRLSSSTPNLQNIPVRTSAGRSIRAAFVPEPGMILLAADYSQVELRMLAHLSEDERLRQAFAENRDIHRVVAAEINDIDEDEVTPDQRAAAKAVNFGIIYGQTAHGLSQTTGMTQRQAQLFIDAYFEQYPRVKDFIDEATHNAHNKGYVQTIKGRRREIPELKSSNKMNRARAEREAVNTIIQGSAADLIKLAMIDIHARLKEDGVDAKMLLQVHDELIFESAPDALDAVRVLVRDAMETALPLAVPLVVDMGEGANWLEAK